jgi:hypothetical protein
MGDMVRGFWLQLSPFTRALGVFLLLNVVVVNAILIALPWTSRYETPAFETYKLLRARTMADSWEPMAAASSYLREDHATDVYDGVFFEGREKFQYPLTSLLPVEAVQRITGEDTIRYGFLDVVSYAAMAVTAVACGAILAHSVAAVLPGQQLARSERVLLWATAVAATLTFYPAVKAVTLGQIQAWSNALFAVSLWLWMRHRGGSSGIAIGAICALKPQMGLLLAWGILRSKWRFAAGLAVTIGMSGVAALALYGFRDNWAYLSVLRFISRHGEAYYPNQSVNGFLNRMFENGGNLSFEENAFPPYHAAVHAGTLITSAILIAAALVPHRHIGASTVDFAIAALTFTVASPVAWEHHYGILAPIYAAIAPAMLARRALGALTVPWLGASYVLTSNYFDVARRAADTPFTPVQSYLLAGALMLLVAMYRLRAVGQSPPANVDGVSNRRTVASLSQWPA